MSQNLTSFSEKTLTSCWTSTKVKTDNKKAIVYYLVCVKSLQSEKKKTIRESE